MAREFGTFLVAANYEPLKAAPFDARSLVETKTDLISKDTWYVDGDVWLYNGMIVAVGQDINPANNGVYILMDANNYQLISSWKKLSNEDEIRNLQEQIDNLEIEGGGSLDVEIDTELQLPEIGDDNTTYYIKENSSIQRWDAENKTYVSYGGAADFDINIIHGGNSHVETN